MAVAPVTYLLVRAVIGQNLCVDISFIGGNSLRIHLPPTSTLCCLCSISDVIGAVCVIARASERGLSSCQSVGQVQFGSWGTVIGWGPARMSVWWQGCTPPLGLCMLAIILLIPSRVYSPNFTQRSLLTAAWISFNLQFKIQLPHYAKRSGN